MIISSMDNLKCSRVDYRTFKFVTFCDRKLVVLELSWEAPRGILLLTTFQANSSKKSISPARKWFLAHVIKNVVHVLLGSLRKLLSQRERG